MSLFPMDIHAGSSSRSRRIAGHQMPDFGRAGFPYHGKREGRGVSKPTDSRSLRMHSCDPHGDSFCGLWEALLT